MIIATTVNDVRKQVKKWKAEGLTVGLVPTMGALHEGHASLVAAAVSQCDRVVASVFVNPTQFGVGEDLDSYPRDFEHDCRILEEKGCSIVFHPEVEEMYPPGFGTYVNLETEMTKQLCGKSRPGHFCGVCTQKDAQQLAVIRQMVRDMNFDIEIVGCPIVREADGLAKSSRNSYLSDKERMAALVLSRSIKAAEKAIEEEFDCEGEGVPAGEIKDIMTAIVAAEPLAKIDYIEAVDGLTLMPKDVLKSGDLVAMAVYIGKTRLIDNFTL